MMSGDKLWWPMLSRWRTLACHTASPGVVGHRFWPSPTSAHSLCVAFCSIALMSAQTSNVAVSDETEVACPFVGCLVEQVTGCSESAGAASFTANAIRVPGTTWNERDRNSYLCRKNTLISVPTSAPKALSCRKACSRHSSNCTHGQ